MKTNKYRVHLHSKPDTWAPYSGYVDVRAKADFLAEDRAIDELKRTSFPDRPRTNWLIERVEQL